MDADAAARAWVDAWRRAWPTKNRGPLAAVYADDVVFRSQPFREVHAGREGVLEYARWAFADQEAFGGCWFGEPVIAGDRATVEWMGDPRRERPRGDDRGRRAAPVRPRRSRGRSARLLVTRGRGP